MRTKNIYRVIWLLPILCACQSEVPQEMTIPTDILTVKASFSGSDNTRTQITYGNTDKKEEIFSWTAEDEIFLYNMTQFEDYLHEACFEIQPNFGKNADFKFAPGSGGHAKEFKVKSGDVLLAVYGETQRVIYKGTDNLIHPDERNIVRIGAGTESNSPQIVMEDPDDADMSYMQGNLKMYDIVSVVEDDSIPELHFKHLSAILRVTLRNETGHDIYPTKMEFHYPGTQSFFNTNVYCGVNTSLDGLQVYTDNDLFKDSFPYTDNIGTTINTKDGTTDTGEAIASGETYDLYLSTVPRLDDQQTGNSLTINLIKSHDTDHPYSITLDGFNVAIKAGKRYWFNLTAVEEEDGTRKLMLTSEWLKLQEEQKPNEGEETTPEN